MSGLAQAQRNGPQVCLAISMPRHHGSDTPRSEPRRPLTWKLLLDHSDERCALCSPVTRSRNSVPSRECRYLTNGRQGHLIHDPMPMGRRMTALRMMSFAVCSGTFWLGTGVSYIFVVGSSIGCAFPRRRWFRSEVFPCWCDAFAPYVGCADPGMFSMQARHAAAQQLDCV